MARFAPYLKALVAALVAALVVVQQSLQAGTLSAYDYVSAVVAGLVALGAVFAVPNKAP